ncbi:MAG TPA: non-ribosomal peptide synthetase [Casimicrobiaceae bacterium]|nr:non-ribosomal peptide synthetase [Casimicrobiaceae bacterium]
MLDLATRQRAIRSRCFHPSGTRLSLEPEPGPLTIHAAVEAQAAKAPDRLALVSATRSLSYRQLNEEANRLARVLIRKAGPEEAPIVVGCAQPVARIVALLAAMKAGRPFVAVDPADPPPRTRSTLEALGGGTLVTDDGGLAPRRGPSADPGIRTINIDTLHADESADDLRLPISADAVARIVLTSGSTGEPKGIMQTHRTTLCGAIAANDAVQLCGEDRMLAGASVFSAIWRPMLVGAAVHVFDFRRDDLNCLRGWVEASQVSVLRTTPSVFRRLLAALGVRAKPGANLLSSLRVIEMMGEPLSWECVRLYQEHSARECILINFLGAKEVLDYRHYYVDHDTAPTNGPVPAGFALGDASVTIVDDRGDPVLPGESGEITVKTRSMSPGYWRRPDLTNERFGRDAVDGERIYRTGDRGVLDPGACLLYLGRLDSTVKIRGQRVDVACLEEVLRQSSSLAEAAVIVSTTEHGENKLSAFVVARVRQHASERDLRRELATQLPDSMIPAEFVFLDAMPTTAMGKVDREGLRSLAALRPRAGLPPRPRGSLEAEVATLCAQVLNRNRIGVEDNFFELGGDSLTAMLIAARIQERFEVDLPLSVVFERPTVEALARLVSKASVRSD